MLPPEGPRSSLRERPLGDWIAFGALLLAAGWVPFAAAQSDPRSKPDTVPETQQDTRNSLAPTPVREYEDETGFNIKVFREDPRFQALGTEQRPGLITRRPPLPGGLEPEVPTPTLPPTPVPEDPRSVLVAVVGGRAMTRADLERRTAVLLPRASVLHNVTPGSIEYEEVRLQQEGAVVQDWIDRVLLAEEAKRRRLMLGQSEFERQYQSLLATAEGKKQYENTMNTLGLTPGEVRAEYFDRLLGDKVVEEETEKSVDETFLRSRYEIAPHLFFRPAQAHVLLYSQALEGDEDRRELRRLRDQLDAIRARIAKGESPAAIAEEEGGRVMGAAGLDLGWVEVDVQSLPGEVHRAIGSLKPGETSRVLISSAGRGTARGLHVVKVVAKRPAIGNTFESARPLLLEGLHEAVRIQLVEDLKASGGHPILVNLSGLPPSVLEGNPTLRAFSTVREGGASPRGENRPGTGTFGEDSVRPTPIPTPTPLPSAAPRAQR